MKILQKTKLWIIIALVIVVAGAAMFAGFGFNQTPDNKAAYEITVGVDQDVEGSGLLVKQTAENYFNEKGYKFSCYATQKIEDGAQYVYKFNNADDITATDINDLKQSLDDALANSAELGALGLETSATFKQTATTSNVNAGLIILACALALVATFVIALFIVKLASAATIVINAVFSVLIFAAIIVITRVPAAPGFAIAGATCTVLSVAFTFVITCGYKEALKSDDKAEFSALAFAGVEKGFARICFVACAGLLAAIALAATLSVYLVFTGAQIAVATLSAAVVSCVSTPVLWSALKNVKNKK